MNEWFQVITKIILTVWQAAMQGSHLSSCLLYQYHLADLLLFLLECYPFSVAYVNSSDDYNRWTLFKLTIEVFIEIINNKTK